MFRRDDAVREMWRHGKKMSYQDTGDVCFLQKKLRRWGLNMPLWKSIVTRCVFQRIFWRVPGFLRTTEDSAACIRGMSACHAPWGRGSISGFKPYALGIDFQLCDSLSGYKGAQRGNCAMQIDKDSSSRPHEKA